MPEDPEEALAVRIAVLETRVDNDIKEHGQILTRVDKLTDNVEKLTRDNVKLSVYVKALWPALSITLTVIGFLIGRFVL